MANAPRQVARAKEDMENIIVELHLGATWRTLAHRIAEGMRTGQSGLIEGPISKGLSQTAEGTSQDIEW